MRLTAKKQCAQTQALIAQFLRSNKVKVVATKQRANTQRNLRSKHIGKNCVARSNARV